MKAAIYRRYGPPDVVQIADVPRPDLGTKDVLVKVRATGQFIFLDRRDAVVRAMRRFFRAVLSPS